MLLLLACMVAAVAAAPPYDYDQSQNGDFNLETDIKNIVIVVGYPKKFNPDVLSMLLNGWKRSGDDSIAQNRADAQVMDAFVEPSTPYRVVIGSEGKRIAEPDSENAIVISGRRRSEVDLEPHEEMKLIGALEQCGPDRIRDPVTLTCEFERNLSHKKLPEVIPVPK